MFRPPLIVVAVSGVLISAALGVAVRAGGGTATTPEAGFIELFDGKTLKGWTDANGKVPSAGWEVVDGAIHRKDKAGYLVSDQEFVNFDLRFDWKIVKGANSGIKYRTTRVEKKGLYGCEYQLLDNDNHPNGKKPTTRCGSLYDLYAPEESQDLVRPVGEYNTSRVVAEGTRIEHWLNGKKVLAIDTASEDWRERIGKSKFKSIKDFASEKPGPILLQDHNNEVWFRNIVIRPLPSPPGRSPAAEGQ